MHPYTIDTVMFKVLPNRYISSKQKKKKINYFGLRGSAYHKIKCIDKDEDYVEKRRVCAV